MIQSDLPNAKPRRFLSFLLILCLFVVGNVIDSVDARADEIAIDDVRAGFRGVYKVGEWSPLFVTVTASTNREVRLVVVAPDVDADKTILTGGPVTLKAGKPARIEGLFKTGRRNGELQVQLESEGQVLATKTLRAEAGSASFGIGLQQSQQVWAAVGNPAGLEESLQATVDAVGDEEQLAKLERVVIPLAVEELPTTRQAYAGIDTLIVATAAAEEKTKPFPLQITKAQNAALDQWVRTGGYLVLSVGSEVKAFQNSPLSEWIPVPVIGQTSERQLSELESIARGNHPLRNIELVKMANVGAIDGVVVKKGLHGPTLVRVPYGFGRITFLAVDLNRKPIVGWEAADLLLEQVVEGSSRAVRREKQTRSGKLSSLGVTDLTSQFHALQQHMEGVGRVSIWTIMGLILVYVALIGPLDYWLVHKLLKRPQLTWMTFPLIAAVSVSLAIITSNGINGRTVGLKRTSFFDFDAQTGQLLVRTWGCIYSPENARYTVSAEANPIGESPSSPPKLRMSWSAMAEDNIGGMNRQGGIHLTNRSYNYGEQVASLEQMPVQHWSAKNFVAEWTQKTKLIDNTLRSPGSGRLSGYIAHQLSVPLEDCVLAYGTQAYRIDSLAPHQQWSPSPAQSRDLRSFLTGTVSKRVEGASYNEDNFFEEMVEYDPLGREAEPIARMLTFHESAGGSGYTGMTHDVQPELDYTEHLKLGRAVLFANCALPATQVFVDGVEPENNARQTFVRILLPVLKVDPSGGVSTLLLPDKPIPVGLEEDGGDTATDSSETE